MFKDTIFEVTHGIVNGRSFFPPNNNEKKVEQWDIVKKNCDNVGKILYS